MGKSGSFYTRPASVGGELLKSKTTVRKDGLRRASTEIFSTERVSERSNAASNLVLKKFKRDKEKEI